ncbi:MAG: alpha/beta fold hydrolase [Desulfosalsimonadaceae bacterium]
MIDYPQFRPPTLLRNPFVQSYLASAPFRAIGKNPMRDAAREMIIETTDKTRLQGFYSPHPAPAGVVLLIHGWEGSSDSTYVRCTGRYFFERGYSIFRLNLRDHGSSHHLNAGLFFGSLFKEVFDALGHVARLEPDLPLFMAGFSLGGNYILRLSVHARQQPIPNLSHAVAVSPVIDPARATRRIDSRPSFRYYFLRKWRRSLVRKQAAFPGKYDFADVFEMNSVYEVTAALLKRYARFSSPEEYFQSYTLSGSLLGDIGVPTTIISAQDDPIIPADDFEHITLNDRTRLSMQRHGGHNGFIESLDLRVWYQPLMEKLFQNSLSA